MLRCLFALSLSVAGTACAAQPPSAPSLAWTTSGQFRMFAAAGIALSLRAGTLAITETSDGSNPGHSLDNIVQYRSPDGEVFGTVYIYLPGLAHSGLTAFTTDFAIRSNSTNEIQSGDSQVVAAGGIAGSAIRRDYSRYRGDQASSAAFLKVGRWMVKLRVSGPQERQQEVQHAMAAILQELRVDRRSTR